jgi:hypothetical protein
MANGPRLPSTVFRLGRTTDKGRAAGCFSTRPGSSMARPKAEAPHHRGAVFRLVPNQGRWKEEILYNLCAEPACSDVGDPWGNLIMDAKGDLFGTGFVAFELSPGLGIRMATSSGPVILPSSLHRTKRGGLTPRCTDRVLKRGRSGTQLAISTAQPCTVEAAKSAPTVAAQSGSCLAPYRVRARRAGPSASCTASARSTTMEYFRAWASSPWTLRGTSMAPRTRASTRASSIGSRVPPAVQARRGRQRFSMTSPAGTVALELPPAPPQNPPEQNGYTPTIPPFATAGYPCYNHPTLVDLLKPAGISGWGGFR